MTSHLSSLDDVAEGANENIHHSLRDQHETVSAVEGRVEGLHQTSLTFPAPCRVTCVCVLEILLKT